MKHIGSSILAILFCLQVGLSAKETTPTTNKTLGPVNLFLISDNRTKTKQFSYNELITAVIEINNLSDYPQYYYTPTSGSKATCEIYYGDKLVATMGQAAVSSAKAIEEGILSAGGTLRIILTGLDGPEANPHGTPNVLPIGSYLIKVKPRTIFPRFKPLEEKIATFDVTP